MILRRKLQLPGLPDHVVERPRLDALFERLLADYEALAVFAAAGSGKTVQAQMFATRRGWPLAWLNLDPADRSGSRLVYYLAEALAPVAPGAPALVTRALDSESSVEEAAAMVAESLDDVPTLVVLDDCEAVAGSEAAAVVLGAFLDYLPPKVRTLLLSRDEIEVPIARLLLQGRVARVSDADMALDDDEARALLAAQGQPERDPAPLMEATRGWIAALAFDVRADLQHPTGPDALAAYLNGEVLARLPIDEQRFLLRTSLPRAVTARTAVALCGREGYALWQSLSSRHLPATITQDRALVYHPRFREFLREQLQVRHPDEVPDLTWRYARMLEELDMYEEATQAFLDVGALDEAARAAEQALPALFARADWNVLLGWLDAVGDARVAERPCLEGARIRALYGTRRVPEAQLVIRRLHRRGELSLVAEVDPGVVAYLGWALQWRPGEAFALLREYGGDYRADAVRYELEAVSGREPVVPPPGAEWSDMERIMTWGLLVQGRLGELLRLLPEDGDWPPRSFWRTPHPMIGLLWRGEVARARQMWDEVPAAVREGAHTDLWFFHEAWLSWAEGDVDAALAAAEAAAAHSRKTSFGWEPCFDVVVGYMLILSGRLNDARSVLADSISRSSASGMRSYVEWAQAFQGLAFLRSDRVADAQRTLRRCVESMQRAERRLMLPFAGAYLAEAEARAGEDERATAASELAYDAAAGMGALFALQRALRDVPGVLQRQIGRDGGDGRWRRVVGVRPTGLVATASSANEPHDDDAKVLLDVHTFGDEPDLIVNGAPCEVRRLKVLELAAHLALHPDGVDRNRLQEALFPDADQRRGGNYFRQVVHKLRQATGFGLARSAKGLVCWPPEVHVDALDVRVERALREAAGLSGAGKLDRLRHAVSLATGPYLRDSELEWVEARRFELEVLLGAARVEAAELALELADADVARTLAEGAIAADPFSEPAYRVLMSVEAAVGPPGAVLTVYQRLCESLNELEVEPAAATKRLVNELRSA